LGEDNNFWCCDAISTVSSLTTDEKLASKIRIRLDIVEGDTVESFDESWF
jgi:hypothetical protein